MAWPMDVYLGDVRRRAEAQGCTVSESLLEDFCRQAAVDCRRIEVDRVSSGVHLKTPDYELWINGCKLIAEVKEIRKNKEEEESERLVAERGYGKVLGGPPGARVRKKITDSSPQIRQRTKGRHPGILVLYDRDRTGRHLDPYHIMTAMYGLEVVHLLVPEDPAVPHYSTGTSFGPGKKMAEDMNTSVSAIGVMALLASSPFVRLLVYHNAHAEVPIDPATLARDGITQFRIDRGTRSWVKLS